MLADELAPQPGDVSGEDPADGRVQRRALNRQAVLDSLSQLIASGHGDPTIEEVAVAAGVSPRSIQRYFGSLEVARDELRSRIIEDTLGYIPHASGPVMPGASLEERCASLVASRFELYDRVGAMIRNSASRHVQNKEIGERFAAARELVEGQVFDRFEPELGALNPDEQEASLAVVNALLSFESIDAFLSNGDNTRSLVGRRLVVQLVAAFSS